MAARQAPSAINCNNKHLFCHALPKAHLLEFCHIRIMALRGFGFRGTGVRSCHIRELDRAERVVWR